MYIHFSLCLCGMLFKPLNFLSLLKFMFETFFPQCFPSFIYLFIHSCWVILLLLYVRCCCFIHTILYVPFLCTLLGKCVFPMFRMYVCISICTVYILYTCRTFVHSWFFIHSLIFFVCLFRWLVSWNVRTFLRNGGENSNTTEQRFAMENKMNVKDIKDGDGWQWQQ